MNPDNCRVISPVKQSDFLTRYWEREPLHIERHDKHYFDDLIAVQDIDGLLSDTSQTFPDLQLTDANRTIAVADYRTPDQRIDAAAVRKFHMEGATIVLSAAHLKFPSLARLCRSITSHFVMRSQANVYLSPASEQGFKPHFDTHDVFILQASGSKTFRFYSSSIELPFTDDAFDASLCADAELQEQVTVNAGDTLYIPRGIVHDAVASGLAPSLHITLGLFPLVLRDLLQEMVQVAGESEVALRRSVLHGTCVDAEAVASLLGRVINDDVIREAQSRLIDEVALGGLSAANNSLSQGPLTLQTTVRLDNNNAIDVESLEDQLKVRLHGQILEFEGAFTDAVRFLLSNHQCKISDLPGLDRQQQLALCVQLYASGFIELVPIDS